MIKFRRLLILVVLSFIQIAIGETLFIEVNNETNQPVYLERLNHQYSIYSSTNEKEDIEPDALFLDQKMSRQLKVDVLSTMYFKGPHLSENNKKDGMLLKVDNQEFFIYLDLVSSSLFKPAIYYSDNITNKYTVEVSEDKNIPSFFTINIAEKKVAKNSDQSQQKK